MKRFLACLALVTLAACAHDTAAPVQQDTLSDIDTNVAAAFDGTAAAAVDPAGIGGSAFPDSLALTTEQKAKIQALHDAFRAANATDLAALKAIEAEARAAIAAKKTRAEVMAILEKARPIQVRLAGALLKLQADIWAVYTPAQQAWILGKLRTGTCRADALSSLTADQVKKIRELRAAFAEEVKGYAETIKKVNEEARAAAQAGASREEVRKILTKADPAMQAIAAAEKRLAAAILGVLTAEQKKDACLLRALIGG